MRALNFFNIRPATAEQLIRSIEPNGISHQERVSAVHRLANLRSRAKAPPKPGIKGVNFMAGQTGSRRTALATHYLAQEFASGREVVSHAVAGLMFGQRVNINTRHDVEELADMAPPNSVILLAGNIGKHGFQNHDEATTMTLTMLKSTQLRRLAWLFVADHYAHMINSQPVREYASEHDLTLTCREARPDEDGLAFRERITTARPSLDGILWEATEWADHDSGQVRYAMALMDPSANTG